MTPPSPPAPRPRAVLVTGARAPATLEVIRRLARAGHRVFAADSVRHPLSRGSRYLAGYVELPGPRAAPRAFAAALRAAVRRHRVDLLLPTCEEIYYVARFRTELARECEVFCPDLAQLATLHHKERFVRLADSLADPVGAPESRLVATPADRAALAPTGREWVFKPVYSRFASRTVLRPPPAVAAGLRLDPANPWLAQRFVAGQELSSYAVVHRGRVGLHVLYRCPYRAGRAAGYYFAPEQDEPIFRFVERLAARTGLTGHLACDFIRTPEGRRYVLECNPRLTSGIHLLDPAVDLAAQLLGTPPPGPPVRVAADASPKRLAFAGWLYGLGAWREGTSWARLRRDFRAAADVVRVPDDPGPGRYQLLAFAEICGRALLGRTGLRAAATADIEWNGQPIG